MHVIVCHDACYINTCTKLQLLLGEGSSAFLKGKFEPFSRCLAMGGTWRSATPSSCSPAPTPPTLPRAASAVLKPCLTGVCFFFGFRALSQAHHTCFFTATCRIIYCTYTVLVVRNKAAGQAEWVHFLHDSRIYFSCKISVRLSLRDRVLNKLRSNI